MSAVKLFIYTFDTFVLFVFLFYIQVVERTNFNFGLDSDVVNKVSVFSEKNDLFFGLGLYHQIGRKREHHFFCN